MATLSVSPTDLVISLTLREKVAGLHGDVRVPLAAVTEVGVVQDPVANVRGVRAPGLSIPGRTKIGTWRSHGHRIFAVARQGIPGVRVILTGTGFDELLISVNDAAAVAHRVRAALN